MSSMTKKTGTSGHISTSSNNDVDLESIASISEALADIQDRLRCYHRKSRHVRFSDGDGIETIEVLVKFITATQKCLGAHCEQLENIRSYIQDKNLGIVSDNMGAVNKHIVAIKGQMEESVRVASLLQVRLELLQNDHAQLVQANQKNIKKALPSNQDEEERRRAPRKGPQEEPTRTMDYNIYFVRTFCIAALLLMAYLGYRDVLFYEEE
ncbi:hypothetical protein F5Y00DRAFT_267002 [Daldinia vernicosa]|uniref:uncharacterized protein n=1 Tax=Daldinia vernicosa TaxID=114800 RepID=UPI002007ED5E|nr:uncharacterized protein F5Y00DRAFT_267002 [Daldinia vernicosa]KAI0843981.1 hypothetical protein F5Y00DRAFT_267002 [Daldinia vernicosa]